MALVSPSLAAEVRASSDFDASACLNCGTCTATCPMGLDPLPRRLFRYVLLGLEDKIRESAETVFSCLLCRMCEANCPAEVPIAENVRSLRRYLNRAAFGLREAFGEAGEGFMSTEGGRGDVASDRPHRRAPGGQS